MTNALVNPPIQGKRADYLHSFGLINIQERNYLKKEESRMACLVRQGKYVSATRRYIAQSEYLTQVTNNNFLYNVLMYNDPQWGVPLEYTNQFAQSIIFLNDSNSSYRSIFSIPSNLDFSVGSSEVTEPLIQTGDQSRSSANILESLLSQEVNVLVSSGQLDGVTTAIGIFDYMEKLDWEGAQEFKDAEKSFLITDGSVVGWYQKSRNLIYALVNKAGHYSTYDQPENLLNLAYNFTSGQL